MCVTCFCIPLLSPTSERRFCASPFIPSIFLRCCCDSSVNRCVSSFCRRSCERRFSCPMRQFKHDPLHVACASQKAQSDTRPERPVGNLLQGQCQCMCEIYVYSWECNLRRGGQVSNLRFRPAVRYASVPAATFASKLYAVTLVYSGTCAKHCSFRILGRFNSRDRGL